MLENKPAFVADAVDKTEHAIKECLDQRRYILDNTEGLTEGLDLVSVERFITEIGLPVSDYLVMTHAQWPGSPLAKWEQHQSQEQPAFMGRCYPGIDISMVFRHERLEELNGPIVTQRFLAHELEHGSHLPADFSPYDTGAKTIYAPLRWGKRILSASKGEFYGQFYSEAYAEWFAGQYLLDQGYANGLAPNQDEWLETEGGLAIRSLYTYLDDTHQNRRTRYINPDSDVAYRDSALAATSLDILIAKNPELKEAVIDSHFGVRGNREFARLINQMRKGLYMELFGLKYNEEDFKEGLQLVANLTT